MTATLPRPGSIVQVQSAPPPRTVPTDTGTWFVTGFADRGKTVPTLIQSLSDFTTKFGARQTYSPLYDALETFFREGGTKAIVSRVVGPAPVLASVNLLDNAAAISLVAKAKAPGAYGNSRRITVQVPGSGGTGFSTLLTDTADASISEQSPDFLTQADAVAWSVNASHTALTLGVSVNNPVAIAAAAFTGGTDDRANALDAQWVAAMTKFTRDYGPGQITQVGRTTAQAYTDTLAHARDYNRVAILDGPDSASPTTLKNAVAALRPLGTGRYGGLFAPWVIIPGLTINTTRTVPPSALVCGKIAASDGAGKSPGAPAAGAQGGVAKAIVGLSQVAYDNGSGVDITRDDMYTAGVNQIVYRYGVFEVFGWRSIVDPIGQDLDWTNLGCARTAMFIVAQALAIAENYILDPIDGRSRLFKAFQGDLIGMLQKLYLTDALFGATPEEAFSVDVGAQVNTPTTIASRELHAAIGVRMSEDAELVIIQVAKVPITQSL